LCSGGNATILGWREGVFAGPGHVGGLAPGTGLGRAQPVCYAFDSRGFGGMAGSVNKVILVGNLGRDPEARNMQTGGKVVSFSVATSESWNDRASGERKEKTQWHRVAIFNEKLGEIAEKYLRKGSKVYLEGQLESRKYTDKDGQEREITEVVLGRFKGELTLLDGRGSGGEAGEGGGGSYGGGRSSGAYGGERSGGGSRGGGGGGGWDSKPKGGSDLDDDIPF
jgi:single-strand DNA-binding protein